MAFTLILNSILGNLILVSHNKVNEENDNRGWIQQEVAANSLTVMALKRPKLYISENTM